jgi:hypothetical protein
MTKKRAHIILFFGDFFCFLGLLYGYHEVKSILMEITNQADMIRYGNRVAFFIFGIFLPPIHLLTIVEHFWPN